MDEPTRLRVAALFSSLGHPDRLRVVELLIQSEMSVNEISETLKIPQSNTSQHLGNLLRTGILDVTPKGTSRYYRIRGPRIARLTALIEEFCKVQGLLGDPRSNE